MRKYIRLDGDKTKICCAKKLNIWLLSVRYKIILHHAINQSRHRGSVVTSLNKNRSRSKTQHSLTKRLKLYPNLKLSRSHRHFKLFQNSNELKYLASKQKSKIKENKKFQNTQGKNQKNLNFTSKIHSSMDPKTHKF